MSALRANQAVRMGLRASSRNPELAFGKALVDLTGSALSILPIALAGLLLSGAVSAEDLLGVYRGLARLQWPMLGALATVSVISFTAGAVFWAGALPVLAADAEMDARPPPGNFALLAAAGFARVASASALAFLLSLAHAVLASAAIFAGLVLYLRHPAPLPSGLLAAAIALALLGGGLLDLLARLIVVRAAALGEGTLVAFGGALRVLAARLGSFLLVTLAFWLLELVVAMAGSTLGAGISTNAALDADRQLLAMAPRAALYIATGAVFVWIEVARQGALAAIVANEAGLLEAPRDPEPPESVPRVLYRPPPVAELVVEALPVKEPVIEALPVPQPEEPGEK